MEQTATLRVRQVQATLEERNGDLHIVVQDAYGNEFVLRAQCTSADRIRLEAISKKGAAHIDIAEPSKCGPAQRTEDWR